MKSKSRHKKTKPSLAVTLGEPAGIGPEIVAKLFTSFEPRRSTALVIGALPVFAPFLQGIKDRVATVNAAEMLDRVFDGDRQAVCFVDTGCRDHYPRGRDSRGGGRHAAVAFEWACRLAKAGVVRGLVTAPLSKKSLGMAGYRFTGHTELLARYFDAPDCQMVMVHRDFRVVPLTRHIPVRRIGSTLTVDRIVVALQVVHRALKEQFGVREPRIAVAGLNPHAGEGGVLGREEIDIIEPAIRQARRKRIKVMGPIPGDALFQHAQSGTFDAFVTMYHDQGLIPFKMVAKRRGVNVTVGLPIVRTSVDHGVAYDIAGKGLASVDSLRNAYQLAEKLVAGVK
jgi:4-hydroxythreonine-4-phosphate dehydrogenase